MAMKKIDIQQLTTSKESPSEVMLRIQKKYGLSEKQIAFVHELAKNEGGSKVEAALAAGYAANQRELVLSKDTKNPLYRNAYASVSVTMYAVYNNPKVRKALEEYKASYKTVKRSEIESDVYQLAKLRAMFDLRDVVDTVIGYSPEEIVEKIKALPAEASMCIDSIEFKYWGKDADRFTANIKFADRQKNLEFLSKLTGLFTDKKDEQEKSDRKMPTINIAIIGNDSTVATRNVTEDE